MKATREQVVAYRIAAQGLHRDTKTLDRLAVLDIGVQDSGEQAARLAFDARLAKPPATDGVGPGQRLALVWSLRGAPHVHRRRDLDALAGALWPLTDGDAAARLDATPALKRAGISALEGFTIGTDAVREVVTRPTPKGEASRQVSDTVPDGLNRDCRPCHSRHVHELIFRLGSLPAGIELEPGTSPPVLTPRKGAARVEATDVAALRKLIVAYLTVLGPASQTDVAGYLGSRRADLAEVWPDELVEVDVEGKKGWLPAARAKALGKPPAPDVVRLLGAFDPYLQARDRNLIVPDKALHKTLWPILGRPGVVLADGEVIGTWRPRASGKKLQLKVQTVVPAPTAIRRGIEDEAQRVAAVRGATDVAVIWSD